MEHKQTPTFNGIHPEAKAAAEAAASAAGLTVEEWISRTILNIARGSAALIGPTGAGRPGAPPAVTVPNQKSVAKAAQAAGIPVDEWLSRAVLESLATSSLESAAELAGRANSTPGHLAQAEPPALPNTLTAPPPGLNDTRPQPALPQAFFAEPAPAVSFRVADDTALLERDGKPIAIPKDPRTWRASSAARAEIENAVVGFDPSGLDALQLTEALSSPPEPPVRSGVGKKLAIGVGLGTLVVLAIVTWVVPQIVKPQPGAGGRSDVAKTLPKPAAKPLSKAGTTSKTGGAKRAQKGRQPEPDTTLPPPTKDTSTLPEPAAKHVAWYTRAAELGNTKAQIALAKLYLNGKGVAQDRTKAAELFRKAAVDGNEPEAQYALGVLLEHGDGVKQDDIEALLWYRRAAAAGLPLAMYRAGLVHLTSKKVPRDYTRAREYFETAARRGVAAANYQLGLIHERGLGTAKSRALAFDHFARAGAEGYKPAIEELERLKGQLTDEDIIRTTALPVPADKHLAWYARASKLGKTKAQLALAKLYLRGQGIDRDYAKAFALFYDAAARGRDPDAQYAVAVMLERGMGVAKNQAEALKWYSRAAKAGHSRALLNLGFAYVRGVGVPQDYTKARQFFKMAADKDLAEAQYNLGLIYEHGLGIDKDVPMAFKWYSLAVANQNAPAGKALDRLIPRMSNAEIARAKRLLTQRN
jgi:TPR repeat protein